MARGHSLCKNDLLGLGAAASFHERRYPEKINELAGKTTVREIHFTVGYNPARKGKGRRAVPPKLILKERDKRIIAECTETLKDRELAEIVKRVMQAEITRRRLREEPQGR